MGFSFDNNGNLKQSKMFLYSSKTKPIGILSGACNVKLEQNFHKLFELNFKIYKNINNEENEFYDSVIKSKLIEVQYINWFQILSAVEKYDDNSKETYKEVKCCPLENMLIYRKVDDIVGVFGLYDITDTSKSLLHIISAECGWSIGHVSNELLTKYRTFDINSMEIYNLLTTKISDSFGCVFQFDSYTKTINAYILSELEEMTDIIISKKNILKEYIKDDSDNPIVTKMRVRGADDLDIRSVNFGRNYLVNLDYYMTEDWCSQGLVDAYNTYKTDYNNIRTSFNTSLAMLKTKNAELTTLKAELKDLESLKSAQENVMGVSVQSHGRVPIPSDSDYTIYQNAVTLLNGYVAQIVTKKNQITSKQNEINSVQSTLDSISDSIDESNYFTPEQIAEMNGFIVEGDDYEDSTFVVTSETTEEEALEIKTELMQNAYEDLFIKSRPQYTFTIKATSLYTIQDDKDELIPYSEWVNQFKIGSLITLNLGSSYMTVRLMTMIVDFDNPEEIDLVFSNKSRLDDELIQLAEIIADSGRTASSLSLKKMGYDAASKQTNQIREFMNGSFKATLNNMINNEFVETEIGEFGIKNRQWLQDQNKYSDYQSWWNQNTLLFSSDGFRTAQAGIGKFTTEDDESFYGFMGEAIISNIIASESLTIKNINNKFVVNKDGAFLEDAEFIITKGNNKIKLNPDDGFTILNGSEKVVYLDIDGNANFKGNIIASKITLTSAEGLTINNGNGTFTVSAEGHIHAESGDIAGFTMEDDVLWAGEDDKYIRISSSHTYIDTPYGAIDLGLSPNINPSTGKKDTIIHLRSDGYARFGLNALDGAVKFNYEDEDFTSVPKTFTFFTKNFRIANDGLVTSTGINLKNGSPIRGYDTGGNEHNLVNFSPNNNVVVGEQNDPQNCHIYGLNEIALYIGSSNNKAFIMNSDSFKIKLPIELTGGDMTIGGKKVTTVTDLDSLETEWQTLLQTSYNNGYDKGDSDGYSRGYNTGDSVGYSRGYNAGDSAGYSRGYAAGLAAGGGN